jgi:hypothetical protein
MTMLTQDRPAALLAGIPLYSGRITLRRYGEMYAVGTDPCPNMYVLNTMRFLVRVLKTGTLITSLMNGALSCI